MFDGLGYWELIYMTAIAGVAFCFGMLTRFVLSRKKKVKSRTDEPTIEELTEQKFNLAEANIKMLENKEQLEELTAQLKDKQVKLEATKHMLTRQTESLKKLNDALGEEKDKSERLLLNILPPLVAEELKFKGHADPEHFDDVTVLFTDIVNFTAKSAVITPAELIGELNIIFTEFDNIIERNNCERIKTIGDAYLAISGITPQQRVDHVANMLNATLEIIHFLNKRNDESKHQWEIRAGIHTGSLVGGIVGVKKYIYDIFGDTVNTAARLEQHSEPMRINVSQAVFEVVQDRFDFREREPVEMKGKGLQKMYFLERPKLRM